MSHALLEENSVSVGLGEHFTSLVIYKNLRYRPYKRGQWSSTHSGHCQHIYFPIPGPFLKLDDAHALISDIETKVIVKAKKQRAMLPSSLVIPQSFLDAHIYCSRHCKNVGCHFPSCSSHSLPLCILSQMSKKAPQTSSSLCFSFSYRLLSLTLDFSVYRKQRFS